MLRDWHGGKTRIDVTGEDGKLRTIGPGLEKLHLGELVAFHGAEATETAILVAKFVWPEGWPRTLAWFTSPKYGGGNFHEALSAGRRLQARSRVTCSKSEAATLAQLVPEVLARLTA